MHWLRLLSAGSIALLVASPNSSADSWTWTGAGANSNWTTATDWDPSTTPLPASSTVLNFGNSTLLVSRDNIGGAFTLNRINFTSSAVAYSLVPSSTNTLQFAGVSPSLTQDSASNILITLPIDFSVNTTFDGSGSGDVTLSPTGGNLGGASGFTKTSSGRLILTASSASDLGSTGGINLNAGSTEVQNISGLGLSTAASDVSISNAKLSLNLSTAGTRTSAASKGITLDGGTLERLLAASGTTTLATNAATPGVFTVRGNSKIQNLETATSGLTSGTLTINYGMSVESNATLTLDAASTNANAATILSKTSAAATGQDISITAGGKIVTSGTGAVRFGTGTVGKVITGTGSSAADAAFVVGDADSVNNTYVENVSYVVNGSGTGGLRIESRNDNFNGGTATNALLGSAGERIQGLTGTGGTFTVAWKDSVTRNFDYAPSSASAVKLGIDAADGSSPVITIGTSANNLANWDGLVVKGGTVKQGASQNFGATSDETFDLVGGTFDLTVGDATFGGIATLASGAITTPGAGKINAASFTKTGAGTVTVGAGVTLAPSTSTDTIVAAGKLSLGGTINANNVVLGAAGTNDATFVLGSAGTFARPTVVANAGGTLTLGGENATGNAIFTGGVTLNKDVSLTAASGGTVTIQTAGISGTGGITKIGAGTVALNIANSYNGATAINVGTLQFGVNNAIPAASAVTLGGGTLDLNGKSNAIASLALNSGSLTGAGTLTISGNATSDGATLSGSPNLTFNVASGTNTVSGSANLTGVGAFTKTGAGTLAVTCNIGVNGTTDVQQGTLRVDGSILSGAGVVNVSGGTLGGNGTINRSVHAITGSIAPGASIGTLTITGNTTFDASTSLAIEVGAASQSDRLVINGNLSLASGAILSLTSLAGAFDGSTYTILTYTGTRTGTFTSVLGLDPSYSLVYNDTSHALLATQIAPEPTLLAPLSVIPLLLAHRRRRVF